MFTDIGKVMMAFILATDIDFIAYMSKMAFFWKLFSLQGRFWNMIHLQTKAPYEADMTLGPESRQVSKLCSCCNE